MSRESKKRTNLMHNECRGVNDRGETSEEWSGMDINLIGDCV
jgi:hypothetical protein